MVLTGKLERLTRSGSKSKLENLELRLLKCIEDLVVMQVANFKKAQELGIEIRDEAWLESL